MREHATLAFEPQAAGAVLCVRNLSSRRYDMRILRGLRQAAPARLPFLDGLTHIVKRLPVREAAAAATHLQVSGHSVQGLVLSQSMTEGFCPDCMGIMLRRLSFPAACLNAQKNPGRNRCITVDLAKGRAAAVPGYLQCAGALAPRMHMSMAHLLAGGGRAPCTRARRARLGAVLAAAG